MSSSTYTEKSITEWYYSVRGDGARRGLVSEVVLSRMATEGNIHRHDLVWNKATGDQWVPASTIPGLFPEREPEPISHPPVQPVQVPPVSRRHRSSLPILLMVGVCLVWSASWFCQKLYMGERSLPAPVARLLNIEIAPQGLPDLKLYCGLIDLHLKNERVEKARELIIALSKFDVHREVADIYRERLQMTIGKMARRNALTDSIPVAAKHLDDEQLDMAEPLIADLMSSEEHKAKAMELSKRAAALRAEQIHRNALVGTLQQGKQTPDTLRQLVAFYAKKNRLSQLVNLTESILQNHKKLPARACMGVAQLYLLDKKTTHAKIAMENYAARLDPTAATSAELMEAKDIFYTLEEPLKAASLLEKHVEKHPDAADVWLELAAIRAEANETKSAMECLKNALKAEDPKLKEKAAGDKRFAPLRDTWSFRRLVKLD